MIGITGTVLGMITGYGLLLFRRSPIAGSALDEETILPHPASCHFKARPQDACIWIAGAAIGVSLLAIPIYPARNATRESRR